MGAERYYTLMSSLPHLPKLDQVQQLPISWIQLQKRKTLLEENERELVEEIQKLMAWFYHPSTTKSRQIVQLYHEVSRKCAAYPVSRKLIADIFQQRTIVSAFRMKALHRNRAKLESDWGVGEDVRMIENAWDAEDFNLSTKYPWVKTFKRHFDNDNPLEMTKFLMERTYGLAQKVIFAHPFTFDAYIAYLTQWALLQKWLTYDARKAAFRFENLIQKETYAYTKEL